MPKIKGGARSGSPKNTLGYMQKEMSKDEYGTYNLLSKETDIKGLTQEFKELESGRGVRAFYHEIVAFSPKDRARCTPEIMKEFSEGYIEHNYKNQQVAWCVHRTHKGEPIRHVHAHFCISATGLDGKKLHRTMDDMLERDRYTQNYAKERGFEYMKELKRAVELRRTHSTEKNNRYLDRMDRECRPVENTREKIKKEINEIIKGPAIANKKAFIEGLEARGMTLSRRETGVEYNNRTYRFKGLGFEKDLYRGNGFKDLQAQELRISEPTLKLEKDRGMSLGMGR